uniref:Reverse transcriptase domain-containing protein n=1 Tax=Tanacetum cinerariifolium TaxID=118510 RepID=A0A6L2NVB4_TANCI|nr:reverse transcriptase domain-containing protein [Tanacetum cinerariifolium]
MADNRTMEEMLQAPTEGYGDSIMVLNILAENFEIRTSLLSLIQANQFHGFESNNPNDHIRSFNRITSTLKFRDVPNDAIKLMLFPYSLEEDAKIWYEKEPPRSILTWGDLVSKYVNHFFPPSNTTHLKNEITRFTQKFEETFGEAWERFQEMLRQCPHHGFSEFHQINTFYNGLNEHDQDSLNAASGGNLLRKTPQDALIIIENKSKVCYSQNKPVDFKVSTTAIGNSSSTDARIDKLTDTISNLVETFNKKITTPATVKAVEKTCVICGGAHPYYDCIATDSNILSVCATTGTYNQGNTRFRPNVATNYRASPLSFPLMNIVKNELKSDINELRNMMASYFQKDTTSTLGSGSLPSNTVANPRGDLKAITTRSGVSYDGPPIPPLISFLPKVVERVPERKLSLSELTSMQMILELANRSTIRPAGIAEDVSVKVGKFHFPTDFVVVDYVVDPRIPLILRRPFLRTERALIDVYGEELTLCIGDEAITINVGKTLKYSYNDAELINRIDVIDVAYEDDFIMKEIKIFLQPPDELSNLDDDYYDTEEDILYLEKLINKDSSPNIPPMKTEYLKQVDATMTKPSIEEPLELELKELPSHLEYAFVEGTDKLPVIISKELKDDEKSALLKVLKSNKRAIAWKISDIKDKMLQRCKDTNLVLNWEKCHFMDNEGVVLDHKISMSGIKVDRAKVDVIAKLPHLIFVKGAKNLMAEHLSRLENPHQDEIENKEITETFPLETLEAKALPTNDARVVVNFLKSLLTRFETPRAIISDRGTHFCNDQFAKVMLKYGKFQLNELNELRDQAYENSLIYEEKTKKIHDSKIKDSVLNVGDRVLLFNSRLKIFSGKLKSRWTGPFTVAHILPYETIKLSQADGFNFKVNGHKLKHYFGGDIPKLVVPDLQTFPMDK